MDCQRFQKNLEDYLEGGLDFAGRFGMERHAQQCYVCGKGMAAAQKLSDMAREMRRVAAPVNFEATVIAKVHARDSRSWLHDFFVYRMERPSWRSLAYGVSAIALLGISVFLAARAFDASSPAQPPLARDTGQRGISAAASPQNQHQLLAAPVTSRRSDPTEESSEALVKATSTASPRRPGARLPFPTEEEWLGQPLQAGDHGYLEYPVPGQGNLIMRLPKTIRMRYSEPSQEHFIRNVSH